MTISIYVSCGFTIVNEKALAEEKQGRPKIDTCAGRIIFQFPGKFSTKVANLATEASHVKIFDCNLDKLLCRARRIFRPGQSDETKLKGKGRLSLGI